MAIIFNLIQYSPLHPFHYIPSSESSNPKQPFIFKALGTCGNFYITYFPSTFHTWCGKRENSQKKIV